MSATKIVLGETRRLFREWRAVAAMTAVYALLLAVLFLFVATGEATLWQVTRTLLCAGVAPALLFILQAMIVNYAQGTVSARLLLKSSPGDSCRLAIASLPPALLAWLLFYLTKRPQAWLPPVALSSLRLLLFGVTLPLIVVGLWSATLRFGLRATLKGARRVVAGAFAPESFCIYFTGLLLFGGVPYLLLLMHTTAGSPALAFGKFIARLLLVFVFTLLGWVLTVAALARVGDEAE